MICISNYSAEHVEFPSLIFRCHAL